MQSRNVSFSESERDKMILKVYDANGKSAFAKHAMYEYIINHQILMGVQEPQKEKKSSIKNKKTMFK